MIYLSQIDDLDLLGQLTAKYKLGLESYVFGTAEGLDNLAATHDLFNKDLRNLADHGLSLHGPFFDLNPAAFDSLVRQATWQRFSDCYQAAQQLGADRIIFHSGFLPLIYWEESWRENSVCFWREFLADKDDSIALHLENSFETSFENLARVIDEVGHPAFSICLDLGHANVASQVPLADWIKGLGGRIGHLHLHNNWGKKDQHLALTEGSLAILELLELIRLRLPQASWTLEHQTGEAMLDSISWLDRELPGWQKR